MGLSIFYQYIVASLVVVVLIITGDVFSHKLHKFINIHVRDVPVTQNINCIVVIDSYGLWIIDYHYNKHTGHCCRRRILQCDCC